MNQSLTLPTRTTTWTNIFRVHPPLQSRQHPLLKPTTFNRILFNSLVLILPPCHTILSLLIINSNKTTVTWSVIIISTMFLPCLPLLFLLMPRISSCRRSKSTLLVLLLQLSPILPTVIITIIIICRNNNCNSSQKVSRAKFCLLFLLLHLMLDVLTQLFPVNILLKLRLLSLDPMDTFTWLLHTLPPQLLPLTRLQRQSNQHIMLTIIITIPVLIINTWHIPLDAITTVTVEAIVRAFGCLLLEARMKRNYWGHDKQSERLAKKNREHEEWRTRQIFRKRLYPKWVSFINHVSLQR